MPQAIFIDQFPEFINLVKEAHDTLTRIMDGLNAPSSSWMEYDTHIPGLKKLNLFALVTPELYQIIKNHGWSSGGSSWQGFKGPPSGAGHDVMTYYPPANPLPGGKSPEVGGYEKDPGAKYYNASEPSLNLEFKWNSGDRVEVISPFKGKHQVPALSYVLNAHVKSVAKDLAPNKTYSY